MSKVRVESFSISLDGFGAGVEQRLETPLGVGGESLHEWFLPTRTFQRYVLNKEDGEVGVDDEIAARGFQNVGAWILGRNMFGPVRGPWPDDSWKGWWGKKPVYQCPVFVLTHHERQPEVMEGGTTFYFVTGGIHEALRLAKEAADGKDVRIGGGVSTIQQFLIERLIDEMHLAIAPVVLGRGERLFEGVDLVSLGYQCVENIGTAKATHVVFKRMS